MPTLQILAGPNGVGKTTFYETAIRENLIDRSIPFINVDLITRNLVGGYTAENFAKADEIARQEISKHLNNAADFMIESNLATQRDYDWIDSVRKKGYNIVLYFLCTNNIDINIGRVRKRVAEGGHEIAAPIVEQRYKTALTYLKGKLHLFEKAYLIDNSGETALVMAELSSGVIVKRESLVPEWTSQLLFIAERLGKK